MSEYKIRYTSKWDGKTHEHTNRNNESDARGWGESFTREHGGRAEVVHVDDRGRETHVQTTGDDKNLRREK